MKTARGPRVQLLLLLILGAGASGCGYSIRPPYEADFKKIYVPVFKNETFRKDLNFQLTELVIKEIQRRTPYKVVNTPEEADALVDGIIRFQDKNLMTENPQNLPRNLTANMTVDVRFQRKGDPRNIPLMTIQETVYFQPEIGETTLTAFQRVMEKIARQIVDALEAPWGDSEPLPEPAPGLGLRLVK